MKLVRGSGLLTGVSSKGLRAEERGKDMGSERGEILGLCGLKSASLFSGGTTLRISSSVGCLKPYLLFAFHELQNNRESSVTN